MNDRQKDWIIFLGVVPDLHGEAVAVVREWREYARANGDREYCCRLLETVRKNYARLMLPEVPKGILKLPDRLQ